MFQVSNFVLVLKRLFLIDFFAVEGHPSVSDHSWLVNSKKFNKFLSTLGIKHTTSSYIYIYIYIYNLLSELKQSIIIFLPGSSGMSWS